MIEAVPADNQHATFALSKASDQIGVLEIRAVSDAASSRIFHGPLRKKQEFRFWSGDRFYRTEYAA